MCPSCPSADGAAMMTGADLKASADVDENSCSSAVNDDGTENIGDIFKRQRSMGKVQ